MWASSTRLLVLVALVATLLFNFPWVSLFSQSELSFGVPRLYLYLFLVWALLILAVGLIVNTPGNGDRRNPDDDEDTPESTERTGTEPNDAAQ